ncbi:hypothetical protein PC123_g17893 [Phytophthora cactorum]|nr:hypothetical protein PC123_g17893 [Phytophthora cactorum]
MRLNLKDEPLLDETMELPSLSVAPRPPHPRGGRGSFSSSYSSGFAGTDSLVSFNSSQLFDDSDDHEVDVDAMDSNSSRGDYALLSMPVESVKRMVPTTGVVTRSSNRTLNGTWNSQDCSFGRATAIADALRELREGRVAVEDEETEPVSVTLRQLVTRLSTRRDLFVMAMGLLAASIHGVLWALLARQVQSSIAAFTPYDRHDVDFAALTLMLLSLALGVTAYAAHLCLSHSSERLLRALREQLLRHLLLDRSQSWFDSNKSIVADFGAELTRDSLIIRQGLGPELGAVCRLSLQFIGGFTVAFMAIWDLTLAISCVTPIIVRVITIVRQTRAKTDNEADAVATEALSNMQTVLALNAQRRVREKHALRVRITEKERVLVRGRHAALRATLTGTLWVSSAIGLCFYRRLHLIQHSAVREQYLTEAPAPIQQQQETRAALTSPTKLTKRDIKALSRPERQFLAFGLAASVIVGLGGPLLGVLISEMAADMVQQYSTYLESYDAVRLVQTLRPLVMRHGIFLGAGAAVIVVFQSVQLFCLDAAAERVASHLRDLHFSSLLAQPLAFFDQYNTKELVESLATQASTASLAVGRAQGYKLQIFCTLTTTFVLAFWSGSWMLTLVLLAALPLLLIGYSIHNQQRLRAPTTLGATEEAVEIHVNEALRNRRAVVILGLENSWCSSFDVLLQRPLQSIRRKARLEAVGKGFSAVVAVAACALSCWLGGVLEHYGDATFQELMRSLVVVIVSAESLGLAVAWLTRIDRALQAGANIFAIRDAAIVASGANEASTSDGERDPMPQSPMLRGSITFQNVCFAYSSRPSSRVLNGLSLHVAAGQTVALCGPRGNSGRVMLDGADMRALEVSWLRAQVSFVGSEPTLFLEGYATRVGGQLQLSPSQRQRIALARTVLEDARLLLLDEPTRSLGAESEKVAVQQALDTIVAQRVRRTTVIAAHPSESVTVRNADLIYVIQDGRVVNQGTHSELFQIQDGVYARLLQASTWSVASSNSYTVSLNTT